MRQLELIVSCDQCWTDSQTKVPAEVTLIYGSKHGGRIEKVIELCNEHAANTTVLDLLGDGTVAADYHPPGADRPPRKPPAAEVMSGAGRYDRMQIECPFCENTYARGAGMSIHVKMAHPERYRPKVAWEDVRPDRRKMVNG